MTLTLQEITEALMSDEFDAIVKGGDVHAVVKDNTVTLMSSGLVLTNPIPVEQKVMDYEVYDKWNDDEFGGSGIVGTIILPIHQIVELLGQPTVINSERTGMRWLIKFEDGTHATIFNDPKDDIGTWCVGGFGHYDKKTKENLSLSAVKNLFKLA